MIQRAMHKSGVDEWLILDVTFTNMHARNVVRKVYGNNSLLFAIVMQAISG